MRYRRVHTLGIDRDRKCLELIFRRCRTYRFEGIKTRYIYKSQHYGDSIETASRLPNENAILNPLVQRLPRIYRIQRLRKHKKSYIIVNFSGSFASERIVHLNNK